jgi:hypothetical protein
MIITAAIALILPNNNNKIIKITSILVILNIRKTIVIIIAVKKITFPQLNNNLQIFECCKASKGGGQCAADKRIAGQVPKHT